jgi:hypothetical protein
MFLRSGYKVAVGSLNYNAVRKGRNRLPGALVKLLGRLEGNHFEAPSAQRNKFPPAAGAPEQDPPSLWEWRFPNGSPLPL